MDPARGNAQVETVADFRDSFCYGSRTDLNFKFLSNLSTEHAAAFFAGLLREVGRSMDDGDLGRILDHVYEWQVRAYGLSEWTYPDGPFVPLAKPLADCRVGLLSSGGHFVEGDDPEPFGVRDMTQEEAVRRINDFLRGDPQLSSIPASTPREKLRIRHGGYDISGAQRDFNVVLPLDRLEELARDGVIGEVATSVYSFVGACAQTRLLKRTGPAWVECFRDQHVDLALLVPV